MKNFIVSFGLFLGFCSSVVWGQNSRQITFKDYPAVSILGDVDLKTGRWTAVFNQTVGGKNNYRIVTDPLALLAMKTGWRALAPPPTEHFRVANLLAPNVENDGMTYVFLYADQRLRRYFEAPAMIGADRFMIESPSCAAENQTQIDSLCNDDEEKTILYVFDTSAQFFSILEKASRAKQHKRSFTALNSLKQFRDSLFLSGRNLTIEVSADTSAYEGYRMIKVVTQKSDGYDFQHLSHTLNQALRLLTPKGEKPLIVHSSLISTADNPDNLKEQFKTLQIYGTKKALDRLQHEFLAENQRQSATLPIPNIRLMEVGEYKPLVWEVVYLTW